MCSAASAGGCWRGCWRGGGELGSRQAAGLSWQGCGSTRRRPRWRKLRPAGSSRFVCLVPRSVTHDAIRVPDCCPALLGGLLLTQPPRRCPSGRCPSGHVLPIWGPSGASRAQSRKSRNMRNTSSRDKNMNMPTQDALAFRVHRALPDSSPALHLLLCSGHNP